MGQFNLLVRLKYHLIEVLYLHHLPTGTAYTGTNPIDVTGSVISFKADTVEFKNDADKGLQLNDISNGQVSWTDPNR